MKSRSKRLGYAVLLFIVVASARAQSGPIDHYVVSVTGTAARGAPFAVTVTALDASNRAVTSDSSTELALTGSTPNVLFDPSGDSSFIGNTVRLSAGSVSISAKNNFAETITITARDANAKTGTSSLVMVNHVGGDYQSNGTSGGNWEAIGTWRTWNGSSWVTATGAPTGAAGEDVTVLSGDTVTLNGGLSLLGGLTVNGTLNFAGSAVLSVSSGGIVRSAGNIGSSAATLRFNAGGSYQHNFSTAAGTIPTASWNSGSTCAIIGYTTYHAAPPGLGQSFYHFTWNCPNQSYDTSLAGNLTTVWGDLCIVNTGPGLLKLKSENSSATTMVNGTFRQSGGWFAVKSGGDGTQTLTVGGFSLTGGSFNMSVSGSSILNVGGDFAVSGGGRFTRTVGATGTSKVNFNGGKAQNFTNNGSMDGKIDYAVMGGSTLLLGTNRLTGSGGFSLSAGARLGIGDPNGITSGTAASGNIQVTGTRSFDPGASYIYNGTTTQLTGTGLPGTLTGNVTNANPVGLSLSSNEVINSPGTLAVSAGALLDLGTRTVTGTGSFVLASGATLATAHASGLDGSIAVSGAKVLSTGANYSYNASTAQAAGTLLPATINSINIDNTAGPVTLARPTTVTGSVILASGARLGLPSGNSTAAGLSIGGVLQPSGTWGNSGSGAANIDSVHFSGAGVLNVSSGPGTSTALASSPDPSTYGQPATFTATVTGAGPLPTGTVTFMEGGTTLGSSALDDLGVASLTIGTLPVAGSPHAITAVYGGDADHDGATSSPLLQVVNAAGTAAQLSSSLNPALPADTLTFTGTITAPSPGNPIPTGAVQFALNGSDYGSPVPLFGGQATLTLPASSVGHGSQGIGLRYLPADSNFEGSTATLIPNQVVNTPPSSGQFELGVAKNTPGSFSNSKLLRDATDADGDELSITAVSSTSRQGGTVSLIGSTLTYTPAADYTGPDTFTYTLSDGFAAVAGTVSVTVGGFSSRITTLLSQGDGSMKLLASGLPGRTYSIEAATDTSHWVEIGTAVATANGLITFADEQAANYSNRNYRLVSY